MRRAERYAGSPCPAPARTSDPARQPPEGLPPGGLPPGGLPPGGLPPDGRPADSLPGGTPARGFSSLRPLRHRAFALLWLAGLVSTIGSWMQTVAVGALIISDTGQATWAVLVAAGAFLPLGLLSPVGGALADRLPRRPVLILGNAAAAATAVVLAVLVAGWAFIVGFFELLRAFSAGDTAGERALLGSSGLILVALGLALGLVLAVQPDAGADTIAQVFGMFSIVAGISSLAVGANLRGATPSPAGG